MTIIIAKRTDIGIEIEADGLTPTVVIDMLGRIENWREIHAKRAPDHPMALSGQYRSARLAILGEELVGPGFGGHEGATSDELVDALHGYLRSVG